MARSFCSGGHDVVRFRIDGQARQRVADDLAGEADRWRAEFDLAAPHLDAEGALFVGRMDFDDVAAHAKRAAAQVFAALVLNVHQAAQQGFARDLLAGFEHDHHAEIRFGRAEAVDAGDGGDDDHVAALEERARGAHAQAVELVVDGGFLFDVGVGGGQIGFGQIVVVVADEIFDGVLRERNCEIRGRAARRASCCAPGPGPGGSRCSMTLAMVKVLPEPVTPSRTWCFSPAKTPRTSWPMASGWSPQGS